jgi:hypothetical protein
LGAGFLRSSRQVIAGIKKNLVGFTTDGRRLTIAIKEKKHMQEDESLAVRHRKAVAAASEVAELLPLIPTAESDRSNLQRDELTTSRMIAMAWQESKINDKADVEELAGQFDRAIEQAKREAQQ